MKGLFKKLMLSLLIAAAAVIVSACSNEGGTGTVTPQESGTAVTEAAKATEGTGSEEQPKDDEGTSSGEEASATAQGESANGLWANAKYTEDTEVGQGSITVKVKVMAGEKAVTITIHTSNEHLGGALLENDLAAGDESEYGLFIKSVNGISADYDKDRSWWAISKDGEMLTTGADSTVIADGENYELVYTKG